MVRCLMFRYELSKTGKMCLMFRYELSKPGKMERLEVDPSVESVRPHVIGNHHVYIYVFIILRTPVEYIYI